ncbi:MAG: Holliday junction resolvase RuvX [Opitutales bacterium]|nr:Holliday junction resolvase RuvX [Opitutales bacterium]
MDYIGIDYGSKIIGLSWGSDTLSVVVPLKAIRPFHSLEQALTTLQQRVAEHPCDAFVVGWPLHMDGREGKRTQEVQRFVDALKKAIAKPVILQDERLSTEAAKDDLAFDTLSLKRSKQTKASGHLDSQAAKIILEDYLNRA